MTHYKIPLELLSDTTFGRGDGVAGLIDQEVEHDETGLPYLRGRALKGLLAEECENLIEQFPTEQKAHWQGVADQLFGTLGSTLQTIAAAHFGDACLPAALRTVIAHQITEKTITRTEVLNALTTIRRQTATDVITGAPDKGSLRSARVILRQQVFTADVQFETAPTDDMLALLALGTVALRRLGSCRNRGRGHVRCHLLDSDGVDVTTKYLSAFQPQEVIA